MRAKISGEIITILPNRPQTTALMIDKESVIVRHPAITTHASTDDLRGDCLESPSQQTLAYMPDRLKTDCYLFLAAAVTKEREERRGECDQGQFGLSVVANIDGFSSISIAADRDVIS